MELKKLMNWSIRNNGFKAENGSMPMITDLWLSEYRMVLKQFVSYSTLFLLVGFFGFDSVEAQTNPRKFESVRTELSKKTCKERKDPDPGNGVLGVTKCQGTAGYLFEITNLEHGQSLALISPAGKRLSIDLFTPMGEESYIDKEIEWRGVRTGETFKPMALIFEHNIVQRIDRDKEPEAKIATVRIGSYNGACLIAAGVENENFGRKEARTFADDVNMPCLTENFLNPPSAYNEEYPSIDEFRSANRSKNGAGVTVSAKGDLNGDGLEDWAGVLWDTEFDFLGGRQLSTLYVLLKDKETGKYRVDGISEEGVIRGSNCCSVEDLQIKNGSVHLQINSKTYGSVLATTYQFKIDDSVWRLVGMKNFFRIIEDDDSTETNMNLLSGEVRVKRQKGDGKPSTTVKKKKFEEFYLRNFDFGTVDVEVKERR